MKKIILSSVAILLVAGLAAGGYWWMSRPQVIRFSDDATITLLGADYGTRHTVPGGKMPKVSAVPATATGGGGFRGFGPGAVGGRGAAPVAGRGGAPASRSFTTPNSSLVVWVRAKYDYTPNQPNQPNGFRPNQNPNFQFYVYDPANTACAQYYTSRNVSGGQRGDDIMAIQFDTFPRREGKLVLRAQEYGNGGQEVSDDKFVIHNPTAGKTFQNWKAEPMPNKQTDGDLAMTLTKLVAGADMPNTRNQDNPDDAMNKGVHVAFHLERSGKPVSNWSPVSLELTDGTGNRSIMNYGVGGNQVKWDGDEGAFTSQNSLWPDEPAWKVRLEMTQTSDFSSADEWTATNIPVVPGSQQSFNLMAGAGHGGFGGRGAATGRGGPAEATPPPAPAPVAETEMNGHHIKVFPAVQITNLPARPPNMPANVVFYQPQQTRLIIQVQPAVMNNVWRPPNAVNVNAVNGTQQADDGWRVTLAKFTDDQGNEIQSLGGSTSTSGTGADSISIFQHTLQNTEGITNLNLTITMHKDHFFDFTVKPEKAAAE